MKSWSIEINDDWKAVAKCISGIRQTTGEPGGISNLPDGEETPERMAERLPTHYTAALAEIGTSLLTNLAWTGCGKGSTGLLDVGNVIEVRHIPYADKDKKGLLVRARDKEAPFVLAAVKLPGTVELLGWRLRRDVIAHGTHRDAHTDKPYWTTRDLHPMDDVMEWVALRLENQ